MRHTQNPRPMQSNLSSGFLWNNLSKTSAVWKLSQTLSRLASVLVLVLAVAGTVAAQVAPPVGPYGFVLNATFSDPSTNGGAAILGLMNFDGAGNVSGPFNFELGSGGSGPKQSIAGSFSGTYSSNPDGTGTISIALGTDLNLTLAMVIDNRGRGLQRNWTANAQWWHHRACNPELVHGSVSPRDPAHRRSADRSRQRQCRQSAL